MQKEKRYLEKQPSFYESAMLKAKDIGIFNRTTLPEDFYLTVFWCRYIHYSRIHPNSMLHSHSFFELHCVLGGTLVYVEEAGEQSEVSAGNFILISPGKKHHLTAISPDAETFALTFEPHCRDTDAGKTLRARFDATTCLNAPIPDEVYSIIESIMDEFHFARSFCVENVKLLLNVMVSRLIRSVFEGSLLPDATNHADYDPRVEEIEKYISDNPSRFFKVSELAEHLNVSPRQLNNVVHGAVGIGVKELIDLRKKEQARRLLLETELSLHEISESLGFSEHNNFNRFFKRMEGLTPGIFRASRGK